MTELTFDEFERLPDPRTGRMELYRGELVTTPPPIMRDAIIRTNLVTLIAG